MRMFLRLLGGLMIAGGLLYVGLAILAARTNPDMGVFGGIVVVALGALLGGALLLHTTKASADGRPLSTIEKVGLGVGALIALVVFTQGDGCSCEGGVHSSIITIGLDGPDSAEERQAIGLQVVELLSSPPYQNEIGNAFPELYAEGVLKDFTTTVVRSKEANASTDAGLSTSETVSIVFEIKTSLPFTRVQEMHDLLQGLTNRALQELQRQGAPPVDPAAAPPVDPSAAAPGVPAASPAVGQ